MFKVTSALLAALCLAAPGLVAPTAAFAETNDPYGVLQWGLRTVEAEAAWSATKGAGSIVAVIDTGVDLSHPDLKRRLLDGRDFADDDLDPTDDNGHGTLVAGIVAASTSNGVGVASVAPSARILPVRVLGADGTGASEDVAEGIRWAIDEGADVINLSLAQESNGGIFGDSILRDPAVDRAIEDAAGAGATIVIAAGNDDSGGRAETSYDADAAGVLVVGATTKTDRRAAYAHYGTGLDMVAPGGGSASDPSDDGCTPKNSIVSTWWDPAKERSDYGGGCGTSMAVGFVSGAAALLHARGMNNAQVAARLKATADDLGTKGTDTVFGSGRLNVRRALGVSVAPRAEQVVERPEGIARSGERGSIRSQGSTQRPAVEPSEGIAASPRPFEPRPGVASGPLGAPTTERGWPVPLAAMLVLLMTAAHWVRIVSSRSVSEPDQGEAI